MTAGDGGVTAVERGAWVRLDDGSIARPEHPVGRESPGWKCILVPCIPDLVQTAAEPRRAIIRTDALEAAERIDDAAAEERLAAAVGYTLASAERQAGRMRELAAECAKEAES